MDRASGFGPEGWGFDPLRGRHQKASHLARLLSFQALPGRARIVSRVELLKQLRSEGRLDSGGKFTLDLAARQRRLEVLQRKEPWLFLYTLAQAAVLAGARQLSVQLEDGRFSLEFAPVESAYEEHFPTSLLGGDKLRTPWLRQLALGALLAFAAEGKNQNLLYDDGLSRTTMDLSSVHHSEPSQGSPLVRFTYLAARPSWWRGWFRASALDQLRLSLQRRLSLCPLNVVLNGFLLPPLVGEQIPGHSARSAWLFEWLYPARGGFAWGASSGRSRHHNQVFYPRASESRAYETRWQVEYEPQRWQGTAAWPLRELLEQQVVVLGCHRGEQGWEMLLLPWAQKFMTGRHHPDLRMPELKGHLGCIGLEAAVQLPYVPQGMARIVPVHHGLCLDEIDFPQGPPGAVIYLKRDDWEVDAGQLRTLPHPEARQQALDLWEAQLKKLESFIYLLPECERMDLPMATRDGWRQYLRKRKRK